MRAIRVRVTDPLHDGELLLVVEVLQFAHPRVQADVIVDLEDFLAGMGERGAEFLVKVVAVRSNHVEAVIAAGEFDDHEDGVLPLGRFFGGLRGVREELGDDAADGEEAGAAQRAGQEIATRKHGKPPGAPTRCHGWAWL